MGDALATGGMLGPDHVRVLDGLYFQSSLTDWADNDVDALEVSWEGAFMVIRTGMVSTVDTLAPVALEGQKVLACAELKGAMLTNFTEFHV